jgi:hypothetical protein
MDFELVRVLHETASNPDALPADRDDAALYLAEHEEAIVQAALAEMTKPDGTLQYPDYNLLNFRNYLDSRLNWSSEKQQMVADHSWLPPDTDRIGHCLIRLTGFRQARKEEAKKSGAV